MRRHFSYFHAIFSIFLLLHLGTPSFLEAMTPEEEAALEAEIMAEMEAEQQAEAEAEAAAGGPATGLEGFGEGLGDLPMPKPMKDIVKNVKIENQEFVEGPEGFEDALGMKGTINIYGKKVPVKGFQEEDEGTSVRFWLPKEWYISKTFSELKELDDQPIAKPAFVLSTFEYEDKELGVIIKKGLNLVSKLKIKELKVPKSLVKIRDGVAKKIPEISLQGVITKKVKESSFIASVPLKKDVKLSEIMQLKKLGIPESMQKKFAGVVLQKPTFEIRLGLGYQDFSMRGKVKLFKADLDAVLTVHKEPGQKAQARFKLVMPPDWKLSDGFPEFAAMDSMSPPKAVFIFSNYEYEDPDFEIPIEPGLNIVGVIRVTDIKTDAPIGEVMKRMKDTSGELTFSGLIKKKIKESRFRAYLPTPKDDVPLSKFLPTKMLPLPDSVRKKISKYNVHKPFVFIDLRPGVKVVELDGTIVSERDSTDINLLFNRLPGKTAFVLILHNPPDKKLSADFSPLKPLDALNLADMKFVFSTHDFFFEKLNVELVRGLNVVAEIALDGPLGPIKNFVDKALSKHGVAYKGEKLMFVGSIPKNIRNASFKVVIPGRLTFDYQKMYKEKVIKRKPKNIAWMRIENFLLTLGLKGINLEFGLSSGFTVKFVKQKKQVLFKGMIDVTPHKFGLGGSMDGKLELAKGFALEDPGIELDIDYKILAATGLPAGFGLRGIMGVGEKPDRSEIDIAAKIEISTGGMSEFIFSGKVDQLKLTQLIQLFSKMAGKNISLKKVPTFALSDVEYTIVPFPAEIAGKHYEQGVVVKGGIKLFDITGVMGITVEPTGLEGSGQLKNIDMKVIKLTGAGPDKEYDTEDDGPVVSLKITPLEQRLFISGKLEIPALKLSQNSEIDVQPGGGRVKIMAKIGPLLSAELDMFVNFEAPEEFEADFEFQQDALSKLELLMIEGIKEFNKKAEEDLEKISAEEVSKGAQEEIEKVEKKIAKLKKEIDDLKDECDDAPGWKKAFVCTGVGAKLIKPGTELAALVTYKEGLVKPGTAVIEVVTTGVRETAKFGTKSVSKLGEWTAKGLGNILNIKKLSGHVSALELMTGEAPRVTLEATLLGKDITLKDLELSIDNIFDFVSKAVNKLIDKLEGD